MYNSGSLLRKEFPSIFFETRYSSKSSTAAKVKIYRHSYIQVEDGIFAPVSYNYPGMTDKILVIGAGGQLGTELVTGLRKIYREEHVIASDIKDSIALEGPYFKLDANDGHRLSEIVSREKITQIYHLAAILSAKAETNPIASWDINMNSLMNVLEIGKDQNLRKIYWPSSIAVFGPDTPKDETPQFTLTNPVTVYGISKLAGERWCEYFYKNYKLDVRSLRYPGLIGYKSLPGGGTTDYAVDIYHKAISGDTFECFLSEDTKLPMMYMEDAISATLQLMEAPEEHISVRSSYNIGAMSFSPREIHQSILDFFPDFEIRYQPDKRQKIADSWPNSIDDSIARGDWGWQHKFDLKSMTADMIENLKVAVG